MVVRVVRMEFKPELAHQFREVFNTYKQRIRYQPGCIHLDLMRDPEHAHIYYTHSHWLSPDYLEQYRHSALFREVWPQTKALFAAPAQAWSLTPTETVN